MENQTITTSGIESTPTYLNVYDAPQWALDVEVIYLLIIILIGIPGNLLILMVQRKNKEKTTTDYYVVSMAVYELLCSSINTTMRISVNMDIMWKLIASEGACSFRQFSVLVTSMSSSFLLAAIALDRYMKTCKPLNTTYTIKTAKKLCIAIFIASIVTSLNTIGTYDVDIYSHCVLKKATEKLKRALNMVNVILTILVSVITSVAYLNIYLVLRKRHTNRVHARLIPTETSSFGVVGGPHTIVKVEPTKGMRRLAGHTSKSNASQAVNKTTVASNMLSDNLAPTADALKSVTNTSIETNWSNSTVVPTTDVPTDRSTDLSDVGTSYNSDVIRLGTQNVVQQIQQRKQQTLNRTTTIMFLITAVYITTWLATWLRVIFGTRSLGAVVANFARSFYMVNCVTNPLFFIILSTKFRESTRRLIMCR